MGITERTAAEELAELLALRARVAEMEAAARPGQAVFNALVEVWPEFGEMVRGGYIDPFHNDDRIADCLRAALATARREGAEEMRRAAGQVCHDVYLEDPSAAVAVCIDAIRALPLDAPGGAT